jgi:molecular chaperone DnaJ
MEAVNGVKKKVTVEKKGGKFYILGLCSMCQGSKCKPGTAPSKCASCAGKGFMNYK